jgi:hypothetical protein
MEKRVTTKVNEFQDQFKTDIKSWVETKTDENMDFTLKSELLQFIFDYEALSLEKTDFTKRKRVKSHVEHYLRCNACRADGDQCTRRKKDVSLYCGTHDKNRPHGAIKKGDVDDNKLTKINVCPQEINGILYYIDNNNNIYKTEDIITNIINPKIIAKYKLKDNGEYLIID